MLIDPFTVAAQVVNFLILVVLMRWLLYGRILAAMDAREERLRQRIVEAEDAKKEAETEAEAFERERELLETKAEAMMADARQEADKRRGELLAEAREEVEARRKSWEASLERERSEFLRELRARSARQVLLLARKVVSALSGVRLEERAIELFLDQLASQSEEEREAMADAFGAPEGVTVRSGFELPRETERRIEAALEEALGGDVSVRFERDSELIWGIEIRSTDFALGWSARDYLDALEESAALELRPSREAELPAMERE